MDLNDRGAQNHDRNGYNAYADQAPRSSTPPKVIPIPEAMKHKSNINPTYQFDNFVEGKSNQLARAAATQVANNPGGSYNPLFIYGGTGLGKTHLLHAVGNGIVANNGDAKIVYMHSERFVQDMVKALQNNAIAELSLNNITCQIEQQERANTTFDLNIEDQNVLKSFENQNNSNEFSSSKQNILIDQVDC